MSRAAERSPAVQRSQNRAAEQARSILVAAQRLIEMKGDAFTVQELIKEAHVALPTFYRHFAGRDELLVAVIADQMITACTEWEAAVAELDDPLLRLRFYVGHNLGALGRDPFQDALARFVIVTHARLHRIFPDELEQAEKPFVDLLRGAIQSAADRGQLASVDAEVDAWLTAELVRSVYTHWAYASGDHDDVQDRLWDFCLRSLGGVIQ